MATDMLTRPTAPTRPRRTLTATDRCDATASGSEAARVLVQWTAADGTPAELQLCLHHYKVAEAGLVTLDNVTIDVQTPDGFGRSTG